MEMVSGKTQKLRFIQVDRREFLDVVNKGDGLGENTDDEISPE